MVIRYAVGSVGYAESIVHFVALLFEWSAPWAAVYLCGWAHWFGYGFLIDIAYTSFYLQQVKSDWGHLPDRVNSAVSNR